MWKPVSLRINNFLSHSESWYIFKNGKCIMIYGHNLTDEGAESNGAGKSVIIEAVSVALTGSSFRDVKNAELVKNGQKEGMIEFELQNDISKQKLTIWRQLLAKGSSSVTIFENDRINDELRTQHPRETDKRILELIGISKDDLLNYFIISKEKYTSFFLSGDTAKKEIINRFSNANIIDPIDEILKSELQTIISESQAILIAENTANTKLGIYKERIDSENAESAIKKRNDEVELIKLKIEEIKKKKSDNLIQYDIKQLALIENAKQIDVVTKTLKDNRFLLELLAKNLQDVSTLISEKNKSKLSIADSYKSQFDEINKDQQVQTIESTRLNTEIQELKNFITEVEVKIKGAVECPKCNHKFVLKDEEFNLEEAINALPEMRDDVISFQRSYDANQTLISQCNDRRIEVQNKIKKEEQVIDREIVLLKDDWFKCNNEKIALDAVITESSKELHTLVTEGNNLYIDLEGLTQTNKILDTNIISHDDTIKDLMMRDLDAGLEEVKKQYEIILSEHKVILISKEENLCEEIKLKQWIDRFKRFKSYLANTAIASIQSFVNMYLSNMRTNLSVIIEGFKVLSTGKIKEEITVQVSRNGLDIESFNKFSSGEKVRADIACILAMQKLINLNAGSGGLNLLFLDEIIESVDGVGVREIVKSLSLLEQNIFIITHTNPNIDFSEKMVVEKRNGNSIILHPDNNLIKELSDEVIQ